MFKRFAILMTTVGWFSLVHGAIIGVDFATPAAIPDGNATGWASSGTVNDPNATLIQNVTVSLSISGGWTGDLSAYLQHGSDMVVLLNHAGKTSANPLGYGDSGLNVTFMDAAPNGDIHNYQQVIGIGPGRENLYENIKYRKF